ncbi:MAG: hypothetical protein K0Q90_3604 [Paenibacillaceae bacterium]|jgi:hypothetical protein|nr:hypothetical protein [Paenibacillaceae bacterium]
MVDGAIALVFAPNQAGKQFVHSLDEAHIAYGVVTCEEDMLPPEAEISRIYLFEKETVTCCRMLSLLRDWTYGPVYVVTNKHHPEALYRSYGATYVIRTNSEDVSFLIENK